MARARVSKLVLPFAAVLLFGSPAFGADYRLEPGDVVEFFAAGEPLLRHRSSVGVDGTVNLPLVGSTAAGGLTLRELRTNLQSAFSRKIFRRASETGTEAKVISPDEVSVEIAEYRPVYLSGDVSKPGAQAFRPGLTVRQAISLAGGYDVMRLRMNNPFLEQSDLKGEYQNLWTALARDQAAIARLSAELAGKADIDRSSIEKLPVAATVLARIEQQERDTLATRNASHQKERQYLIASVAKESGRVDVLVDQQAKERQGVQADTEDLARAEDYYKRGSSLITRVLDARRSVLLSSTRLLQTMAQKAQVERDRDDVNRKLERLDDDRRMSVLAELREATSRLEATRVRLQAVGEKLIYVGLVRSQLVRGESSKPDILIHRGAQGKPLVADEDTPLQPADVVDIAIKGYLQPAN